MQSNARKVGQVTMITLSICFFLTLLAAINAFFSQPARDWVLEQDSSYYYPPFLKSEGFLRAFLINLCFASISTAAVAIHSVSYSQFWMIQDPLLAVFLGIALGFFIAIALRSDCDRLLNERPKWNAGMTLTTIFVFAFSIWTTFHTPDSSSNCSTGKVHIWLEK